MTHTFKKGDTGLTRGGYPYEVVADDLSGVFPIAAAATRSDNKVVTTYEASGLFLPRSKEHPFDLMPPRPTVVREWWMNVYASGMGSWYETRRLADNHAHDHRLAVLRRTFWSDGTRTYEEEKV